MAPLLQLPAASSPPHPALAAPVDDVRRLQAVLGVLLAGAMFLRTPAPEFIYDAADYFAGSAAVLDGSGVVEAGGLELRGVLTPLIYLPAALVAHVFGAGAAGSSVLAQNAVLIALIGVLLVPRVVGIWRPVTPTVVIASAVGTGVALTGFAPYPLSDLAATALLLVVVVALDRRTWPWLLAAGLAAGAAVNIRPAMLLPLGVLGVAVLGARRWAGGWFALGAAVALLPQVALNLWRGSGWVPVPERTGYLTELQAYNAAHVVRYDTVVAEGMSPSLFRCSPEMVQALDGTIVHSPGELAAAFLGTLPQSLVFSAQKIGASLHWPLSTPYLTPTPVLDGLFAVLITTATVIGAAALLRRAIRQGRSLTLGQAAGLLAWAGCLVGLTTSATETRFALPLVVFGLAGCALLAADGLRLPRTTAGRIWVAGTLAAVLVTYGVGVSGMQHTATDGGAAAVCIVAGGR